MTRNQTKKNIVSVRNSLPVIDSKYRAIDLLHEGKSSSIYKVIPLFSPEKEMALKVFHSRKTKSPIYKKNLNQLIKGEFYLYKDLDSRFFPKVYEIGYDDKLSSIYYTMELLENCKSIQNYYANLIEYPLELQIDKKTINEVIFSAIVYKSVLALTYLHSNDIIHYNISPKNILIYSPKNTSSLSPEVKIISLSLAERNNVNSSKKFVKNLYLAPEVLSKKKSIDYKIDYFSLGATLLCSIVGPIDEYKNIKSNNRLTSQTTSSTSIEENIAIYLDLVENKKIKNFIEKLVGKNPNDRFQSGRDIIISLNKKFDQTFEVSKFTNDFSYQKKKDKFIIRNSIIQKILENINSYKNRSKKDNLIDKNSNSNYNTITGYKGCGISRTIRELENTFSLLSYNTNTIRPSNTKNDRFGEIINLLNKLLIRYNDNSKKVNKSYLTLMKQIYGLRKSNNTLESVFQLIIDQINKFISNSDLILFFIDIQKYDECSLKFLNYIKNNMDKSNLFIISSLSYKNKESKELLEKQYVKERNLDNHIELQPLNLDNLKLIRNYYFGKIEKIPSNFDNEVLRKTKGNFKKVISLYDNLYKNEVIYSSFGRYFYEKDNMYTKK